ncbi:MAG: TraX family protein [Candidatus Limivivens sp.]|nr:TraX family protein [Candidatus Limivivens sp.]
MDRTKRPGISGFTLKLIAILTMLIDHIGSAIVEKGILKLPMVTGDPDLLSFWNQTDRCMRAIGRLAFPIFCFLLVEGFIYTRDIKKYAGRLFLFALLSEFPFDLALKQGLFVPTSQNVYFTLLIGLLVMAGASWCEQRRKPFLSILVFLAGMLAAYLLKTDYSYKGILLIIVLYVFRFERFLQCVGGAIAISWELTGPLAFLPIWFYNGKRGRISLKYFFYAFYPVHLLILAGIRYLLLSLCG